MGGYSRLVRNMESVPSYLEPTYAGPYGGINQQAPEYQIPISDTPFMENFEFRNKELRTCPRFKALLPHPQNDGSILGHISFIDTNNVVHTIAITSNNVWQLVYRSQMQKDSQWLWNKVDNFSANGVQNQFDIQIFLQKAYFTNGSPGLFYWDGITNSISEATNSGGIPLYGAYHLLELGSHLIMFNTVEYDPVAKTVTNYPQRIRWCPAGLPTVWDPAVNSAAGFNDMIEVPDVITEAMAIGQKILVFRTNGITQVTLTGLAAKPFQFDHMWASEKGIGSSYTQGAACYGPVGIFGSGEDFYKVTPTSFEAIGGGARDAIMNDLAAATGVSLGTIIPGYHRTYVYVSYKLMIPMGNDCVIWGYSIEDKNWMRRVMRVGVPTTKMKLCFVK